MAASILVSELPTPAEELIPGLTAEALEGQGVIELSREQLTVDGWPALLIDGTQTAAGATFSKWMLVLGGDELSAIVMATYPRDSSDLRVPLRRSLLGLDFDPDRPTDPAAALPFILEPEPPLVFAGTVSNSGIYNTSGLVPSSDRLEPTLVVAPSLGPVNISGETRESFLTTRMNAQANRTSVQLGPVLQIVVGGLEGVEVAGTARDTATGQEVSIYGAALFSEERGYIFASGQCLLADADDLLDVFRVSVHSLRLKVA